jgi:hypothetical protein
VSGLHGLACKGAGFRRTHAFMHAICTEPLLSSLPQLVAGSN